MPVSEQTGSPELHTGVPKLTTRMAMLVVLGRVRSRMVNVERSFGGTLRAS